MVDVVFEKFWNELKQWYGKETKRNFDIECERLFKNVPSNSANEVLKHIEYNYDFFPKFTELRNIAEKFGVVKETKVENQEMCWSCLNDGLIKYRKPVNNGQYMGDFWAACMCRVGRKYLNNPCRGIEEVFPHTWEQELRKCAEKNAPRKSVSQLQQDFERSMDIMDMRSQSFKRGTAV